MKKRLLLGVILVIGVLTAWSHLRRPSADQLLGLWIVEDVSAPADPLHFYYFHKGGRGLYRYGQVAYNKTNSFDWSLEGDKLVLVFRKTGERAATTFAIRGEGNRRTLELAKDPRGAPGLRYRFRPPNLGNDENLGALELPTTETGDAEVSALEGRMWLDYTKYATGGSGFSMYQLSEHMLDKGWRLGWHHRGDSDDWSTEMLAYRSAAGELALVFFLSGRYDVTRFELDRERDRNVVRLLRDPRNFGAPSRFVDAGRSF